VYQINRDFQPTLIDAPTLTALTASLQAGAISEEEFFDLLQRGDLIKAETTFEEHQTQIDAQGPPKASRRRQAREARRGGRIMARWLSCELEDGGDPVMINLDHVVMMSPQPGQSGKTLVELVGGRSFWILNGIAAVSGAIEVTADGAMVDAVVVDAQPAPVEVKPVL
jgi:hypothetical protein